MHLFAEVELFNEGRRSYTDFKLLDAELKLWEQFFPKVVADQYFKILKDTTPWQQRMRKMYDKTIPDPRLTAYYGGQNGLTWTSHLLEIKKQIETACKVCFDRVLLNYYRDGNDSVAWHSDSLPADGKHHHIASVTFGETRIFKVRHKTDRTPKPLDIPLNHGSFLLMGETMQEHYEHQIPKTSKKIGGRINLTFRISESTKPVYFI